jgi:transcriptional regulator with XRE-family HTH domain
MMMKTKLPSLYQLRVDAEIYTQAEMAKRLKVCKSTYARIERGYANPRSRVFEALLKVLRVSPSLLTAVLGRVA